MRLPRRSNEPGQLIQMGSRGSSLTPAAALNGIWGLLLLAFVVAALYFGRAVLVPIALAALITFLLSRLVTRLERWVGRIAAVLMTVVAMFTIFAAASWVIGRQRSVLVLEDLRVEFAVAYPSVDFHF
jgi:predicted PurR-regulated permease PerM